MQPLLFGFSVWLKSIWALLWPQETWLHVRNYHGNPGAVQNSRCDIPRRSSGEMCLLRFASSVDKHCLHLFGLLCPHSPVTLSHTHTLRHENPTSKTDMKHYTRQRAGFILNRSQHSGKFLDIIKVFVYQKLFPNALNLFYCYDKGKAHKNIL